jgi:hypothetical protein
VATAAWHGGDRWWRHHDGGFGWVGPVFWPFAFFDIYDYAFWGYPYDDAFWGYGYYPALFQIADDAGVSVIAPPGPIINADNPERISRWTGTAPDDAK